MDSPTLRAASLLTPPTSAAAPLRCASSPATTADEGGREEEEEEEEAEAVSRASHITASPRETSVPVSPSQRPALLRSPPPPLDRLALTAADSGTAVVAAIHAAIRRPSPPPPQPQRGAAVAVLQRLLRSQSPEERAAASASAAAAMSNEQQQQQQQQASHSLPPHAAPRLPSYFSSPADGASRRKGRNTMSTAAVMRSSIAGEGRPFTDSHVRVATPPKDDDTNTTGEGSRSGSGGDNADDLLPWWKRILVDPAYRQRMMQLSSEMYRRELKLLQDSPQLISGAAGMTQRSTQRERQWWTDDLADGWSLPRCPHATEEADASTARDVEGGTGAAGPLQGDGPPHLSSSSSLSGVQDAVQRTVVMAQHVLFTIPPQQSLSTTFAYQHPHAMMRASALETIRGVALGAMPPVQYTHEVETQAAAVDGHLSRQRRLSVEMPRDAKQRLARDILAGREEVPMQTAITDAVLDDAATAGAGVARSQHTSRPKAGGESWKGLKSDNIFPPVTTTSAATATSSSNASAAPPPRRPGVRPPTPPSMRRLLPLPQQEVVHAQHAVNMAAINIRSSALLPSAMPVKGLTCGTDEMEGATTSAATAAGEQWREASAQEQRLRRQEAADACTDGTEHLYGLQYVWRLSLPPSGFIRLSPDPRLAMWPDDTTIEVDKNQQRTRGPLRSSTRLTTGHRGGGGGGGGGGRAPSLASRQQREHEMRRLARRVNNRTRKLRWLHEIGRRRVCYSDLELLSDAEASSSSSSLSSSFAGVHGGGSPAAGSFGGGPSAATWDPQSPSRFSLNVVRDVERQKRTGITTTHGGTAALRGRSAARRSAAAGSHAAQPVYEGALNINIYAEVPARHSLRGSLARGLSLTQGLDAIAALSSADLSRKAYGVAGPAASTGAGVPRRVFLGCYRQSRLLIHYKVYCRALHEEARLRSAPVLSRLTHSDTAEDDGEGRAAYDAATRALLRNVPVIPFPVLRLQQQAPELQPPASHFTPVLSTVSGTRCWEGLFPSSRVDLTAESHHVWRALRESALVQQAIRDVFEDLRHDKEGQLSKRTYVLFVLQLLELFFPTHLAATTHIAIAEEEWIYRGTTEHVGPRTFHEKFFGFPFIFMRDIAAVTEAALVEFWTLLRLCLRAQQAHSRPHAVGEPATQPEDLLAALHLLVPLTCLNSGQLRALVTHPPPAFDPAVYDRFHLLTAAYRSDPVVRRAPRAHQYLVARTRVEQQLMQRQRSQPHSSAAAASRDSTAAAATTASTAAEAAAAPPDLGFLSLPELLSESGGTASRIGVENAVQREREEHQRNVEAQEKRLLLEQSTLYQRRQREQHERTAAALSGIDCATSSWELHRGDVYNPPQYGPPHQGAGGAGQSATGTVSTNRGETSGAPPARGEDVEEALLEYLDGVPDDVFSGRVSLRERYLLHTGFQQQRRQQLKRWQHQQQHSVEDSRRRVLSVSEPSSVTLPGAAETSMLSTTGPHGAATRQHFLRVMKGEGENVVERQSVVAAECERLLGREATASGNTTSHHTAITTSFASGMYPLRPVPRTISSIVTPSNRRARARILAQHDYSASEVGVQGESDGGSYLRRISDGVTTTHSSSSGTGGRQLRHPATPSPRLPAKIASISFYAARDEHLRRRLSRRHGGAGRNSTTSNGSVNPTAAGGGASGSLTACPVHRHSRMMSHNRLKHIAKSAVRRQRSFLSNTTRQLSTNPLTPAATLMEDVTVISASPSPSPRLSRTPSSTDSTPRAVVPSCGKSRPHLGPTLARPITTVAFLEAAAEDWAGAGSNSNSSAAAASVVFDSSRLLFHTHGDHHHHNHRASHVSSVETVHGHANGAAAVEAQQRLSAAARTTNHATHYAERLRAQQRRQQQYRQRFNAGGKAAAGTTKW